MQWEQVSNGYFCMLHVVSLVSSLCKLHELAVMEVVGGPNMGIILGMDSLRESSQLKVLQHGREMLTCFGLVLGGH